MTDREIMQQALEALELLSQAPVETALDYADNAITTLRERLAQPEQEPIHVPVTDNTYGYAKSLAEAIFKQHFASDEHYASGRIVWGVNDTVIGILTQIDNMVSGMVRKPAQPEQESERNKLAAWMMQRSYATGHGDTVDDLLKELEWQVIEREREACAKLCEEHWRHSGNAMNCADAIRARGNT